MKTYKDCTDLSYDGSKYKYQPQLTEALDESANQPFSQELLNEIVLWKINRYATVDDRTINLLNAISVNDRVFDDRKTSDILEALLGEKSRGIGLAVASTILRFRNPYIYQIIDQRAYRFVMGEELIASTSISTQINVYIKYIKKLHEIANERNCDFKMLDRVLYYLDKDLNSNIKIKY